LTRQRRPVAPSLVHPAEKLGRLRGGLSAVRGRDVSTPGGLYSSLIFEWRRLRDAGLLEGKPASATIGRPSPEQAEIAWLRRQPDQAQRRLATTETALEIMGKAHALLEQVCESADIETPRRRRWWAPTAT
jgi:hypothetical protein